MRLMRWSVGLTGLAVVLIGAGWLTGLFGGGEIDPETDPELAPLVRQMRSLHSDGASMNEQQRRTARDDMRQSIESLSEEKRRALFHGMREQMMAQMEQRIDEYLTAPAEQRDAVLDRHISEMEQRRRQWAAGGGGRPGGPGRGAPAWAGQGRGSGGQAQGQGQARRGPRRGYRSDEQRLQRRARRLDHTTPEMRAKFSEYFEALRRRRRQLGLPESPFPRGPRHTARLG